MDLLKKIFNRLNLIVDGEPAIRFADPEVFRLLLSATVGAYDNIRKVDADGDGMLTKEELATITTLSSRNDNVYSMFKDNTSIERFNEFRYFTGLELINNGCFQGCTSLREIIIPPSTILGNYVFNRSGIEKVVIPEGYLTVGENVCDGAYNCRLIDFPSTITSIGMSLIRSVNNVTTIICRAITPPSFGGFGYNGIPVAIYVPDASVDAYKLTAGWSLQAAKIYPLSTYVEP